MDHPGGDEPRPDLVEATVEDFYDNAPSGHLVTWPDGRIAKSNNTLARWLGYGQQELRSKTFTDLLTAGGRIHYETHFAPMLRIHGQLGGIAVDLVSADGTRLPVFVAANAKMNDDGRVVLMRFTIQDARDRRSYERELLEARERADHERSRVHVLAKTLQRSLIPPRLSPPAGLDADAYYHPISADDVGGDFYDLFPLSHEKWGFFLGDVSGKGAGAAAVTSLTRYTLRAAAVYDDDPVAVLHNLDTVLNHEFHGDDPRFCTVIFGLITRRDNGFDVELASGGHPPALLLRGDGSARYVPTEGGQGVGLFAEASFVATRIHLGAGDTMVLYTDGLTEARTGGGAERYDDDGGFLDFAVAHAPASAATIVEALRLLLVGFGTGLQDDAAVLAVGVPLADH